jgi:hypothetical protein
MQPHFKSIRPLVLTLTLESVQLSNVTAIRLERVVCPLPYHDAFKVYTRQGGHY